MSVFGIPLEPRKVWLGWSGFLRRWTARWVFGLRLQDQTAFVGQVSGINMTTPDQGVEFGWLKGHWDAQLAESNGTAGGAATSDGKQSSAQLTWVDSLWRLGAAANYNNAAAAGSSAHHEPSVRATLIASSEPKL